MTPTLVAEGVLVADRWVLTAAHAANARAGDLNIAALTDRIAGAFR